MECYKLHKQIHAMILRYNDHNAIGKFIDNLDRVLPNLFRFVTDTSIHPTNNAAERGLREIIIRKKIRDHIRAEDDEDYEQSVLMRFCMKESPA